MKYSSWVRFQPDKSPPGARIRQVGPAPGAEPSAGKDVFLDWGAPVAERYGCGYLRLLVQSPHRLFCFWELDGDTAARHFPASEPAGGWNHLVLHLHNLADQVSMPILVDHAESWWLHVTPERAYMAALEVRFPDGRAERIASSNEVRTPRDSVCWEVDPCDLFNDSTLRYLRLLTMSRAEPAIDEFLEILRSCRPYDRVFIVPECLLRFFPDWLRAIICQLRFRVPWSIFADFVLKRYFPEAVHALVMEKRPLRPEDLEPELVGFFVKGGSSDLARAFCAGSSSLLCSQSPSGSAAEGGVTRG